MKLILSSDALPDEPLPVLQRACRRRGLAGLELTVGSQQGHGLDAAAALAKPLSTLIPFQQSDPPVRWLRHTGPLHAAALLRWAEIAFHLEAGLVISQPVDMPPALEVALQHDTNAGEARRAADWAAQFNRAKTAWALDLTGDDSADLRHVLSLSRPTLGHLRLLGGGPEMQQSNATGSDDVWTQLALFGYSGTVALAPSDSKKTTLDAWARWLLDRRGWGCGTAAEKRAHSS